jgi:hypothetical protein
MTYASIAQSPTPSFGLRSHITTNRATVVSAVAAALAGTVSAALFRQAFIALLIQGGYEIAVNALRNSRDRCAVASAGS